MTHETESTQDTEQAPSSDDARFEVKWKKKSEPTTPNTGAQPSAETDATANVAELQRQLEAERERVKDLQEKWQRSAADLVNLRRRTEQERGEVEKFATMLLVQEMLPVLDNFDRALVTIPGNLQMLTWIQGIMLIERHLRALLERQGLEPIEAQGQPFNTHFHEAISEVETEDATPGTVVREYQKGYSMHGRVIRPTLVEVARAPAAATEDPPGAASAEEPEQTDETRGEEIAEEAETENVGP